MKGVEIKLAENHNNIAIKAEQLRKECREAKAKGEETRIDRVGYVLTLFDGQKWFNFGQYLVFDSRYDAQAAFATILKISEISEGKIYLAEEWVGNTGRLRIVGEVEELRRRQ